MRVFNKLEKYGWHAAGAVVALMLVGFQTNQSKIGVVDVGKVFRDSQLAHKEGESYQAVQENRRSIIEFINTYRVVTAEQATRFRELSLKDAPTPAEKQELDKLKAAIIANDKKFRDLQLKPSPNESEVKALRDDNDLVQACSLTLSKWAKEFDDELNALNDKYKKETLDRVKTAIKTYGAKKSFTLIFSSEVVPYGANEVTPDVLKTMDSLKP
ncbi:MAG: OmpH family outer membrane protein [Armatimonadetes bacterium]|nr:OmpH family outer membrane protein [Armatimonadota bacterium]